MESLPLSTLIVLTIVAFLSGTIDSITGGGGLITVPALLATGLNPIAALGTNKLQAAISELSATLHFSKTVNYRKIATYIVYTSVGAALGALLVQVTRSERVESIVPWLLLFSLICFLIPKRSRTESQSKFHRLKIMAPLIGFYNGFFGPGTGSLWSIGFMEIIHLPPKESVMYTKPLNFIGNAISLMVFLFSGKIYLMGAVFMGVGSFFGGKFGAHIVTLKELPFLKWGICLVLILSTISAFCR